MNGQFFPNFTQVPSRFYAIFMYELNILYRSYEFCQTLLLLRQKHFGVLCYVGVYFLRLRIG